MTLIQLKHRIDQLLIDYRPETVVEVRNSAGDYNPVSAILDVSSHDIKQTVTLQLDC